MQFTKRTFIKRYEDIHMFSGRNGSIFKDNCTMGFGHGVEIVSKGEIIKVLDGFIKRRKELKHCGDIS